jgi:hypothetical protein
MSGYSADRQTFQLTYLKADRYHEHRALEGCPCRDIDEMTKVHLLPAGFELVPAKYPWTYCHPGHPTFPLGLLWEALSGRPSTRGLYPDW